MSFHYTNQTPDDSVVQNMGRLNAFSDEQLTSLINVLFSFLQGRHSADSFLSLVDSWAAQEQVNANVLREIVRCALSFFRGSIRKNLSPTYLFSDLKSFGLSEEKAKLVAGLWKNSLSTIKRSAVGHTFNVNQLVDLEWSFGVTAANSDLNKVGDCFLQFKLSLDQGNNNIEKVPLELTLPQFYQLIAELEKAHAHLENISS